MKLDFKGMKFKNWLYLIIFSVLILAVLWALQFLLLDRFYQSMKLNEIKNIGDKISDEYGSLDFQTVMNEYAFKNNLRIIMFDNTGKMFVTYDGFTLQSPLLPSQGVVGGFQLNAFETMKEKFEETKADRVYFLDSNVREDMSLAVYAAKISASDGAVQYLYISSPIPAIDSTVSVLKTQFVIITVVLFILSLVAAQLISKKMSKPIIRLTQSAKSLVKGDLDTDIYEDGFTEIRQLASTLNYATGELRSLDNYRREFIANISHDLKTPLTIIKFYGEMIRDISGCNPEKRNQHCDLIIKEADWLSGMVNEILELSELESGNAKIVRTDINLSRCLDDILASLQVLVEKEAYIFETDIDEHLIVNGSEPMLKRVMYNLISNAVNYTGDDKRVRITLKATGNNVRFMVTDTGDGIPQEQLPNIWDRYYKSNEAHKRAVVGTGLGLSIVKNALILHNAEHGVRSEGKGSTFWFELRQL